MDTLHCIRRRHAASGFSLVEIMIGIAIGMVGLLVIFKTVAVWDGHTRSTVAGGDAQVAGTLAMFNLERDIKLAGMGFGKALAPDMGCTVTGTDTASSRALSFPMFPVQITTSGAAGSPDAINVLYGNSSFFATVETFSPAPDSTSTTKHLARRSGFRSGDLAVVAGNATLLPAPIPASADCRLVQITDNTNPDGRTVSHVGGVFIPDAAYSAASSASRYNPTGGTSSTFTAGGNMYNLGPTPQLNRWQTNGRVLSRTDELQGPTAMEVAAGVINMKAQYGVDADGDNIISDTEWTRSTPTDWTQVRAIRVAILVRSSQFEKPSATSASSVSVAVTTTANAPGPSWRDTTANFFLMTNVDGSTDSFSDTDAVPNNWRFYRYRVYEKVVPIRNMIWGTAP